MFRKVKILYVDSELHNLTAFTTHYRVNKRYELHTCRFGEQAVDILNSNSIDILIVDQPWDDVLGIEFLNKVTSDTPGLVKIIVTAHRDIGLAEKAYKEGQIFRSHQKPFDWEHITPTIEEAYLVSIVTSLEEHLVDLSDAIVETKEERNLLYDKAVLCKRKVTTLKSLIHK